MCDIIDGAAPDSLRGTSLKSTDQAAAEARLRRREIHCQERGMISMGIDANWEADHQAIHKVERRKERGGSTFRPGDGLA